mmetsp:Transcript_24095/g.69252  ORF Transcript_24095/g.69252 Transcript_24095/m.69252 type:complete len:216 (-) Transcript_24095:129-776(-)
MSASSAATRARSAPTGAVSPSPTRILAMYPSSKASTSMSALSDSTTMMASPASMESPSFLSQETTRPSFMVEESAGIEILIASALRAVWYCRLLLAMVAGVAVKATPRVTADDGAEGTTPKAEVDPQLRLAATRASNAALDTRRAMFFVVAHSKGDGTADRIRSAFPHAKRSPGTTVKNEFKTQTVRVATLTYESLLQRGSSTRRGMSSGKVKFW